MENNRGIALIVMIALVIAMILMFFTQLRTQDDLNNTQITVTAQYNHMNATSTQSAAELAAFSTESAQTVFDMQTAVVNVEATTRADSIQIANITATAESYVVQTLQADAIATEHANGINVQETTVAIMSTEQANARYEGMDIAQGTLLPVVNTLQSQIESYSATLTAVPTLQAITPEASVSTGGLIYNEAFDSVGDWAGDAVSIEDGQLAIHVDLDGGQQWAFSGLSFETGYIEVAINTADCPPTTLSGLIYAETYLFLASCDGQTWLVAKLAEDAYDVLDFGFLNDETIRTLGMMAEGESLVLYLNGEEISGLAFNMMENSTVGLYVIAENEATVYFDNLRIFR